MPSQGPLSKMDGILNLPLSFWGGLKTLFSSKIYLKILPYVVMSKLVFAKAKLF